MATRMQVAYTRIHIHNSTTNDVEMTAAGANMICLIQLIFTCVKQACDQLQPFVDNKETVLAIFKNRSVRKKAKNYATIAAEE